MSGKVAKPQLSFLARGISNKGRSASFRKRAFKVALGAKGKPVAAGPKVAGKTQSVTGRFYAADDVARPLPSRKAQQHHVAALKANYTPGTVLILLAGRFRGKRVVLLGQTKAGLLLVCGPFKLNGVPLRRVNQAYTIATSTKVDVSGVDVSSFDDAFFTKSGKSVKAQKQADFLSAGQKANTTLPADVKAKLQAVDAAVAVAVAKSGKDTQLYLKARFSLHQGEFPHSLKF